MKAIAGLMDRVRGMIGLVYREVMKFGAVGACAFLIDVYLYNVLRAGWWPLGDAPMADKPLLSKVISMGLATVFAWVGNRYWTFRHRRRSAPRREFALFVVMNLAGLLIALACLWFSHYVLGFTTPLADNIAGNVVGIGLGTLFRFWAYRTIVFTELREVPLPTPQTVDGAPAAGEPDIEHPQPPAGPRSEPGGHRPQPPAAQRQAASPAAAVELPLAHGGEPKPNGVQVA